MHEATPGLLPGIQPGVPGVPMTGASSDMALRAGTIERELDSHAAVTLHAVSRSRTWMGRLLVLTLVLSVHTVRVPLDQAR